MKKLINIIIAMCLCMGLLAGCQNAEEDKNPEKEEFADEAFLSDLSKALEARWDVASAEFKDSKEQKDNFQKSVETESGILKGYDKKEFKDSTLKDLCSQYMSCLKEQEDSLKYYGMDMDKYQELWDEAYNTRTKILAQLKEDYDFKVSDKYQSIFDEMMENAKNVPETDGKPDLTIGEQ